MGLGVDSIDGVLLAGGSVEGPSIFGEEVVVVGSSTFGDGVTCAAGSKVGIEGTLLGLGVVIPFGAGVGSANGFVVGGMAAGPSVLGEGDISGLGVVMAFGAGLDSDDGLLDGDKVLLMGWLVCSCVTSHSPSCAT